MSVKLYVGNLPFSTTDEELQDHFSSQGTVVSTKIIMNKFSGRSRGFGFVEMSTEEEASKAISMLNGMDLGGRILIVNEARPLEERSQSRANTS